MPVGQGILRSASSEEIEKPLHRTATSLLNEGRDPAIASLRSRSVSFSMTPQILGSPAATRRRPPPPTPLDLARAIAYRSPSTSPQLRKLSYASLGEIPQYVSLNGSSTPTLPSTAGTEINPITFTQAMSRVTRERTSPTTASHSFFPKITARPIGHLALHIYQADGVQPTHSLRPVVAGSTYNVPPPATEEGLSSFPDIVQSSYIIAEPPERIAYITEPELDKASSIVPQLIRSAQTTDSRATTPTLAGGSVHKGFLPPIRSRR